MVNKVELYVNYEIPQSCIIQVHWPQMLTMVHSGLYRCVTCWIW